MKNKGKKNRNGSNFVKIETVRISGKPEGARGPAGTPAGRSGSDKGKGR